MNPFWQAMRVAMIAHQGEYRKVSRVPYFIHPLRVAGILAAHGFEENPFGIAALLHDVVEHGKLRALDIQDQFGMEVAQLVRGLTPPCTGSSWKERKVASIAKLAEVESPVLVLACADKLDNLLSIKEDLARFGLGVWNRLGRTPWEQNWYFRSLASVFEERLTEGPGALLAFEFSSEVRGVFGCGPAAQVAGGHSHGKGGVLGGHLLPR
jgi:hypothetical protein